MRIIAAIPNYNSAVHVIRLAKQLIAEGLDEIYVLDDASSDDSLEKLYELSDDVTVIEGETNLGPAGNRNRILPFVKDDDIVAFIDADMELVTRQIRSVIEQTINQNEHVALFGGGIMNKRQKPTTYNYGLDVPPVKAKIGRHLERLAGLLHFKPLVWPLRKLAANYTLNLEIKYGKPRDRRVDWVSVGHCYIRGSVLKSIDGFDGSQGYREEKLLAQKVRNEAWGVLFTPRIWVKHLQLSRRPESRMFFQKYHS